MYVRSGNVQVHKILMNVNLNLHVTWYVEVQIFTLQLFNRLTPNDPYMSRTAPLTSKHFILYIYPTNIGTELFLLFHRAFLFIY